jgi:hypothetical protein
MQLAAAGLHLRMRMLHGHSFKFKVLHTMPKENNTS